MSLWTGYFRCQCYFFKNKVDKHPSHFFSLKPCSHRESQNVGQARKFNAISMQASLKMLAAKALAFFLVSLLFFSKKLRNQAAFFIPAAFFPPPAWLFLAPANQSTAGFQGVWFSSHHQQGSLGQNGAGETPN